MTTRRIISTVLGLTLGGLLLAGCGVTSPASSANSSGEVTSTASASGSAVTPGVPLQDTRWRLASYQQRTASGLVSGDAAAGTDPIMILSGGRIRFEGLCNGPNGDVAVTDTTLSVASLDRTEMACADGRSEMEKLVIDTFVGTVGYTLLNDTLAVTGADTTLTFVASVHGGGIPGATPTAETGTDMPSSSTPTPDTPLDGTWLLTGYSDAAGDHPVPDGVQPAITLGGGRIGIDTQCNAIGGTLAVTDATLTVTEVIGTMMFCEGPRGEMESLLTGTLKDTLDYASTDGALTVTGPTATLRFDHYAPTLPPPG